MATVRRRQRVQEVGSDALCWAKKMETVPCPEHERRARVVWKDLEIIKDILANEGVRGVTESQQKRTRYGRGSLQNACAIRQESVHRGRRGAARSGSCQLATAARRRRCRRRRRRREALERRVRVGLAVGAAAAVLLVHRELEPARRRRRPPPGRAERAAPAGFGAPFAASRRCFWRSRIRSYPACARVTGASSSSPASNGSAPSSAAASSAASSHARTAARSRAAGGAHRVAAPGASARPSRGGRGARSTLTERSSIVRLASGILAGSSKSRARWLLRSRPRRRLPRSATRPASPALERRIRRHRARHHQVAARRQRQPQQQRRLRRQGCIFLGAAAAAPPKTRS